MAIKIGLIAEDRSDVQVIEEILKKFIDERNFSLKPFVGKGCGKLKNKCGAWFDTLIKKGCEHIFIFHDLDRNDELDLRKEIEGKIANEYFTNRLVVVPREELEAWLLADLAAVQKTFSIVVALKPVSNVEIITSPKEYLARIVKKSSKKIYLNTVHNRRIAELTNIESLEKCESFKPFSEYIKTKMVGC